MRQITALVILSFALLAPAVDAGEGKVVKVLPQYLDKQGRYALSPSLYERDAYQAILRKSPGNQGGVRLAVEWKAKKVDWTHLTMRAEMRCLTNDTLQTVTLQQPVVKTGWLNNWSEFRITGDKYKKFGHLVAWRVTLWDGDKQLSAMESFLWSGVDPKNLTP